jgi:hypothetical protein
LEIRKYGVFETSYSIKVNGNPFTTVDLTAEFRKGSRTIKVTGFYDGEDTYRIRFMPDDEGEWKFITASNRKELLGKNGAFTCIEPEKGNHGPVRVRDTFHFAYDDGTSYFSVGTTCYAWIYQPIQLQKQTLETLRQSCFNKIRMCVFPKFFEHNEKTPLIFPYEGDETNGFDYTRPNIAFFRLLDERVQQLGELGIEADIILFHTQDNPKWRFNLMNKDQNTQYLKYIVSRLSGYHNVWWCMANEYDLFKYLPGAGEKKKRSGWRRFGQLVRRTDPNNHLRSIHNGMNIYDHKEDWITHCSFQRLEVYRTAENTDAWRSQYQKPVVIDECVYEGNVDHSWGNITAEELVRRFWEGTIRGGYMGHSETYVHPDDIIWWSHGGELHGKSPERIQFLKNEIEKYGQYNISPISFPGDVLCGGQPNDYYLYYFSFMRPCFFKFNMPRNYDYQVEIIDTWTMMTQKLPGTYRGQFRLELPGVQFILVRMVAVGKRESVNKPITIDSTLEEIEEKPVGAKLIKLMRKFSGKLDIVSYLMPLTVAEISKKLGGNLNDGMVDGLLILVNGKTVKGIFRMLKGFVLRK